MEIHGTFQIEEVSKKTIQTMQGKVRCWSFNLWRCTLLIPSGRLLESATKPGFTKEHLLEEQTKLLQISTDLKSIERELSTLSAAKTVEARSGLTMQEPDSGTSYQSPSLHERTRKECPIGFSEVRKNLLCSYFTGDADQSASGASRYEIQRGEQVEFDNSPSVLGAKKPLKHLTRDATTESEACIAPSVSQSPKTVLDVVDDTIVHMTKGGGNEVDTARWEFI